MKILLIIIALQMSCIGFGQIAVKKSVVDSGGGSIKAGTITVISTIGEFVIQENTQGGIHISEGFIGPDLKQTVGVKNYTKLEGISLYPNPAADNININFSADGNYQILIYDIAGKQVADYNTQESLLQIPLGDLCSTTYVIFIKNNKTKQYISYKIIKR